MAQKEAKQAQIKAKVVQRKANEQERASDVIGVVNQLIA